MVLASPGPLLTPPPASSPPATPFRSYSATTPPRYGNPTPPSPGGRGSSRRGRGMGGQNGPQADEEEDLDGKADNTCQSQSKANHLDMRHPSMTDFETMKD